MQVITAKRFGTMDFIKKLISPRTTELSSSSGAFDTRTNDSANKTHDSSDTSLQESHLQEARKAFDQTFQRRYISSETSPEYPQGFVASRKNSRSEPSIPQLLSSLSEPSASVVQNTKNEKAASDSELRSTSHSAGREEQNSGTFTRTRSFPHHELRSQSSVGMSEVPEPAKPPYIQQLERALDLGPFLDQMEEMLNSPLPELQQPSSFHQNKQASAKGSFGVRAATDASRDKIKIWPSEAERKKEMSKLYNFKNLKNRKWLKNILLEDSEEDDADLDKPITEADLKVMLKIHKRRRKYQKMYHNDVLNAQYTYYSAGLLCEEDKFAEHQMSVLEQCGAGLDLPGAPSLHELDKPKKKPCRKKKPEVSSVSMGPAELQVPPDAAAGTSGNFSHSETHKLVPQYPPSTGGSVNVPGMVSNFSHGGVSVPQMTPNGSLLPTGGSNMCGNGVVYEPESFLVPQHPGVQGSQHCSQSELGNVLYNSLPNCQQEQSAQVPLEHFKHKPAYYGGVSAPQQNRQGDVSPMIVSSPLLGGSLDQSNLEYLLSPSYQEPSQPFSGPQQSAPGNLVNCPSNRAQFLRPHLVQPQRSIEAYPHGPPLPGGPTILKPATPHYSGSSPGSQCQPSPLSPAVRKSSSVPPGSEVTAMPSGCLAKRPRREKHKEVASVTVTYNPAVVHAMGWDEATQALWKRIVTEDIPKAYNETYIFRKYRSIVLKNVASSCREKINKYSNDLQSLERQKRRCGKIKRERTDSEKPPTCSKPRFMKFVSKDAL